MTKAALARSYSSNGRIRFPFHDATSVRLGDLPDSRTAWLPRSAPARQSPYHAKAETVTVPVPLHNPVRAGTLSSIIRQSGLSRVLFEQPARSRCARQLPGWRRPMVLLRPSPSSMAYHWPDAEEGARRDPFCSRSTDGWRCDRAEAIGTSNTRTQRS
jgi:hypothetical protein